MTIGKRIFKIVVLIEYLDRIVELRRRIFVEL
jgi:hypothetical protein